MWSGKDAADQMQKWHIEGKTNVQGLCLKTCRQAWKLPAKYPSAISAWDNTPKKNKFNDPMKAPQGATHFWKGGKFGHVAIQSHKPGYVWTTDLPDKNKIGLGYYTIVQDRWKYKYLGWTNKLNGVDLNV
jgi:hypothetical protein